MRCNFLVRSPVFCSIGVVLTFAATSPRAQVTIDVSKITCDQYVHAKIAVPNHVAAWLSGYYNAKRGNHVIDLQAMQENVNKLEKYCSDEKNFKVPVMQTVERLFGAR